MARGRRNGAHRPTAPGLARPNFVFYCVLLAYDSPGAVPRREPRDPSANYTFGLARSRTTSFFLIRGWPLLAVFTNSRVSLCPGTEP